MSWESQNLHFCGVDSNYCRIMAARVFENYMPHRTLRLWHRKAVSAISLRTSALSLFESCLPWQSAVANLGACAWLVSCQPNGWLALMPTNTQLH